MNGSENSVTPMLATGLAALLGYAACLPARADSITASLQLPEAGLECADAAAQTRVAFRFPAMSSSATVTAYLDGHKIPRDAVELKWPELTLHGALHRGRNEVEVIASSKGQTISRSLLVNIGDADATHDGAARVPCHEEHATVARYPDRVIETSPVYEDQRVIYEEVEPTVIYQERGPRVVYRESYYGYGPRYFDSDDDYYSPAPVVVIGSYGNYGDYYGDHDHHGGYGHHDGGSHWNGSGNGSWNGTHDPGNHASNGSAGHDHYLPLVGPTAQSQNPPHGTPPQGAQHENSDRGHSSPWRALADPAASRSHKSD